MTGTMMKMGKDVPVRRMGRIGLILAVLTGALAACTPPALEDMPPASEEEVTVHSTVEWVDEMATTPAEGMTEEPAGDAVETTAEDIVEDEASPEPSVQAPAIAQAATPARGDTVRQAVPTSANRGLTVTVAEDPAIGAHLVDGKGRTLYLFQRDATNQSTCTGDCTGTWPPALTDAAPAAGEGVDAALLGITLRDDGRAQVTYADHPLYYFAGDEIEGATNGQGALSLWFIVSPAGAPIQ